MVGTAKRDTKNLILRRAADLLRTRGYNGFSYQDISKPLGIKNAAVHYHYPSKSDLGMALVEQYRELLHKRTSHFMEHGGDPRQHLEGYLNFTLQEFDSGFTCPIVVMSVDYQGISKQMRNQARSLIDETLAWLSKVLELGREQGVFRFEGESRDKAMSLMSSMSGATQMARIAGRKKLEATVRQARTDLGLGPES